MPLTSYSKLLKIHQREPARTQHSPSFSDLPPEIILNVFKNTDNLSAATTLSSVSRQFNTMWKLNISSISKVILGQNFEAHEEGLALVTALETAADDLCDSETLDPTKRPADQDTVSEAIARIEHFISNAKVALLILNVYEENVINFDTAQPRRLNIIERVQFFKSYYLILVHAIHDGARFPVPLSQNPRRIPNRVKWLWALRVMIFLLRLEDIQSGQLPSSLSLHWQFAAVHKSLMKYKQPHTLPDLDKKLLDLDSKIYWHQKPWTPFFYLFMSVYGREGLDLSSNTISGWRCSSDGQE